MAAPIPGWFGSLTAREKEIVQLLVQALCDKEIAVRLGIRHPTVRFHLANIFYKVGVSSRTELIVLFLRLDDAPVS